MVGIKGLKVSLIKEVVGKGLKLVVVYAKIGESFKGISNLRDESKVVVADVELFHILEVRVTLWYVGETKPRDSERGQLGQVACAGRDLGDEVFDALRAIPSDTLIVTVVNKAMELDFPCAHFVGIDVLAVFDACVVGKLAKVFDARDIPEALCPITVRGAYTYIALEVVTLRNALAGATPLFGLVAVGFHGCVGWIVRAYEVVVVEVERVRQGRHKITGYPGNVVACNGEGRIRLGQVLELGELVVRQVKVLYGGESHPIGYVSHIVERQVQARKGNAFLRDRRYAIVVHVKGVQVLEVCRVIEDGRNFLEVLVREVSVGR